MSNGVKARFSSTSPGIVNCHAPQEHGSLKAAQIGFFSMETTHKIGTNPVRIVTELSCDCHDLIKNEV
jgi:hypothetical protein